MDNLTHSLFGLTLARVPISRVGSGATAALLLASNVPDIDILVTLAGGAPRYLELHRGPSHGPLGVLALSLGVALVARAGAMQWWKARGGEPPGRLTRLWAVSFVGVLCHVLMDLPTSYGTRLLSPFSWTWFTTDWMPIVDVYLIAVLAGGLLLGSAGRPNPDSSRRRRAWATAALMLMLADYAVRAAAHAAALRAVRPPSLLAHNWCADAVHVGRWIDRWPWSGDAGTRSVAAEDCVHELVAIPDFLSPLRWRIVARAPGEYRAVDLDLAGLMRTGSPEMSAVERISNQWSAAVERAAAARSAQVFLGFSRLPAVRESARPDATTLVRWIDLRFMRNEENGGVPLRRSLFGATVMLDAAGAVRADRLGQ